MADLVNDLLVDPRRLVPVPEVFVVRPLVSQLQHVNDHMGLWAAPAIIMVKSGDCTSDLTESRNEYLGGSASMSSLIWELHQ